MTYISTLDKYYNLFIDMHESVNSGEWNANSI